MSVGPVRYTSTIWTGTRFTVHGSRGAGVLTWVEIGVNVLTFIGLVVTQTEHKLGCIASPIAILIDQSRRNESLVDKLRSDFEIGLA